MTRREYRFQRWRPDAERFSFEEAPRISSNSELLAYCDSLRRAYAALCAAIDTMVRNCSMRGGRLKTRRLPVYTWRHLTRHSVHTRFHCPSRSLAFLYIRMYRHSWILCKHFWSDFQRHILASVLGCWLSWEKTCVCPIFPFVWFQAEKAAVFVRNFYTALRMWIFLCSFRMHFNPIFLKFFY